MSTITIEIEPSALPALLASGNLVLSIRAKGSDGPNKSSLIPEGYGSSGGTAPKVVVYPPKLAKSAEVPHSRQVGRRPASEGPANTELVAKAIQDHDGDISFEMIVEKSGLPRNSAQNALMALHRRGAVVRRETGVWYWKAFSNGAALQEPATEIAEEYQDM